MADLEREINLGYEARRLQSAITPYLEEMKVEAYEKFLSAPIRDQEALNVIKLQVNAISALQAKIEAAIANGAIAEEEVRRMNNG